MQVIHYTVYTFIKSRTGQHEHKKYINPLFLLQKVELKLCLQALQQFGFQKTPRNLYLQAEIDPTTPPMVRKQFFHTIYIYKQMFNTVQIATANHPSGAAESQFCIAFYMVRACVCSLTYKYREPFFPSFIKRLSTNTIFSNNPPR